jgi:hypothetical protein
MQVEEQHSLLKHPVLEAGRAIDAFFRTARNADWVRPASLLNRKLSAYEDTRASARNGSRAQGARAERDAKEIAAAAAEREAAANAEALRLRAASLELSEDGNITAAAEYLARAVQAETAGQQDAQLMLEEFVPPPREPVAPKPSSIVTKEAWEWEGLDIMATCQAIVEGKAPLRVLMYNLVAVTKMVNALKHEFNVPGIVARPKTTIATKGKR